MKIAPVGHALSIFFVISFVLCLLWAFVTPMNVMMGEREVNMHMHDGWTPFMPGFHWSLVGVLIGFAWAYFFGWYIALVFVPLYNFFNRRAS